MYREVKWIRRRRLRYVLDIAGGIDTEELQDWYGKLKEESLGDHWYSCEVTHERQLKYEVGRADFHIQRKLMVYLAAI